MDYFNFRHACYQSLNTFEEYKDFEKTFLMSHSQNYICARIDMYIKSQDYKTTMHYVEKIIEYPYIRFDIYFIYKLEIYFITKDVNQYLKTLRKFECQNYSTFNKYLYMIKDMFSLEEWEQNKNDIFLDVRCYTNDYHYRLFVQRNGENED